MTQGKYVELSVAQRTDVWRRWKFRDSSVLRATGNSKNTFAPFFFLAAGSW
jgi:hypothetical protein